MNERYRILDANRNRAAEGLRVLEDYSRFVLEHAELTKALRLLRHRIRKSLSLDEAKLLSSRNSPGDTGFAISQKSTLDNKQSDSALIAGNFKRVQESLRVMEENLKVAGYFELSKLYESLRFDSYALEQDFQGACNRKRWKTHYFYGLYGLTSEEHSLGRSNIEVASQMVQSGIKIIQYREKEKSQAGKYEECLRIREITKRAGALFIVNDDVALAILSDADGIHLGQDDLPIEDARKLVGRDMIIGKSTHSPQQAESAIREGADYLGIGPLYCTQTKKDVCSPVGLEYLAYAVKEVNIPFVAIGGIKAHNIQDVVRTGAQCIALVTEIVGAGNIKETITHLQEKIAITKEIK